MRTAFLELATLDDVADLITLLRQGATVGVSAHPGRLYAPMRPHALMTERDRTKPTHTITQRDPEGFLRAYLGEAWNAANLVVLPSSARPFIEALHRTVGPETGCPLSSATILTVATILATWIGAGRVEPQIVYGDAGWDSFVRARRGWVVLPYRPSNTELQDIATYGARGVILAETMQRDYPWAMGMGGSYPMPVNGLIDHAPEDTAQHVYERATAPSGLSATWDAVRQRLPLSGLLSESEGEVFRAEGYAVWQVFRDAGQTPALAISRPHPTIPREGAGAWIGERWDGLYRVDFD